MKNNKGKGFTLVELLAVIVILAVILIIAMPKISEVIKKTKLSSLEATAKLLINQAEKKYTENQVLDNSSSAIKCSDVAKLNENDYGTCKIKFDDKGNASVILNGKKDGKFDNLTCSGTKGNLTCGEGGTSIYRKCTTSDTVKYGLKFVDGQYTYTYNGSTGWSVVLTDKEATTPVTTELCGSVNDKPIVDMSCMFKDSQATSLNLSSFNTSNVTDMSEMFWESQATTIKGLESFDTSNVTNMYGMFNGSQATSLDLSSFNTSNVTNMSEMFWESQATSLDLSSFNTSNVTNMYGMFSGSQATSLDLSSFNTSNVTIMYDMFYGSHATSLDLSSFNTSNVVDMNNMFYESNATSLDLSSFDTSNVTDMYNMFANSQATTGYAKTCEDAARLNASSNKPSGLTFTVKDTTC